MRSKQRAVLLMAVAIFGVTAVSAQQSDGDVELTGFGTVVIPETGQKTYLVQGQVGWYLTNYFQLGGGMSINYLEGAQGFDDVTTINLTTLIELDVTTT